MVTRTNEQLRANVYAAFANDGAMSFIDAVDPVGTAHRRNYERLRPIFAELEGYEPHAGGRFCQDVGIYYSFDNVFDLGENGRPLSAAYYCFQPGRPKQGPTAHRGAALNLARTLLQYHLPYGVVTKLDLHRLSEYRVIVLPNLVMMDEEEAEALRAYVRAGGSLYASKHTSILGSDGVRRKDFLLADLFGVSWAGEVEPILTYLDPVPPAGDLFGEFGGEYPATLYDTQLVVKARPGAEVLATITLPYTDPRGTKYASILTDPPGVRTEHPALVLNRFGEGQVLYAAGVLESWEHDSQRELLVRLLASIAKKPFWFETDAPKPVELTMFEQPERKRFVVHLLNIQQEMPNVPVRDVTVRVNLRGRRPRRAVALPDGKALRSRLTAEAASFVVPETKDYRLVVVEYR